MDDLQPGSVRVATAVDARDVAVLLDAFNREFAVATPGVEVLTERLRVLLGRPDTIALLSGDPACAVALLTLRPNVWFDGPVALLDELYVAPGRRDHGIGSALLGGAETLLARRGGELMEVNVDGDDTGARRFYERHGYVTIDPGADEPTFYYYRAVGSSRN